MSNNNFKLEDLILAKIRINNLMPSIKSHFWLVIKCATLYCYIIPFNSKRSRQVSILDSESILSKKDKSILSFKEGLFKDKVKSIATMHSIKKIKILDLNENLKSGNFKIVEHKLTIDELKEIRNNFKTKFQNDKNIIKEAIIE